MAIIPALDGLYHHWDEDAAEDGLEKVILGITSPEEILDVASVEQTDRAKKRADSGRGLERSLAGNR